MVIRICILRKLIIAAAKGTHPVSRDSVLPICSHPVLDVVAVVEDRYWQKANSASCASFSSVIRRKIQDDTVHYDRSTSGYTRGLHLRPNNPPTKCVARLCCTWS